MSDEETTRTTGTRSTRTTRSGGDPEATLSETPLGVTPVAADEGAGMARGPLSEDDSENRTKVPLSWLLANGEATLGIPRRELFAAFAEDEREELTLNAARKTHAQWLEKVQNPETVQEA